MTSLLYIVIKPSFLLIWVNISQYGFTMRTYRLIIVHLPGKKGSKKGQIGGKMRFYKERANLSRAGLKWESPGSFLAASFWKKNEPELTGAMNRTPLVVNFFHWEKFI